MTLEEYRSITNKNKDKHYLSNYLTKTLLSCIFVFLILILSNLSVKAKDEIKNTLFSNTFNFAFINNLYSKFTNIFKEDEIIPVFNEIEEEQEKIEEYKDGVKIIDSKSEINLIYSGIVTYIGEKEDYGNVVIVQGSNGIDIWYGNIDEVKVKIYDYVEKGSIVGTKKEYHYILVQKNNEFLDYETTIK